MKQTEYLQLNKPEATDFYHIDDWNENADALDAIIRELAGRLSLLETRLRDVQTKVSIHDFAEMKAVTGGEFDVWQEVSLLYYPGSGSWELSGENIAILAEYNTSEVIGTIREPYRPAGEISGTAVLSVSGNANLSCTVKALPNGQIVLAPEIASTPIADIKSLHLSYKAGGMTDAR